MASSSDTRVTNVPRLGRLVNKPSRSSVRIASRTGCRLTPNCRARSISRTRSPGSRRPLMISARSASAMSWRSARPRARAMDASIMRFDRPSGNCIHVFRHMPAPASVMTVSGPIAADRLGFTLIHEHLLLDLMRDAWIGNNILNDPELALIELQRYKQAGGGTLVDQTNPGLAQDPPPAKDLAAPSRVAIILGGGGAGRGGGAGVGGEGGGDLGGLRGGGGRVRGGGGGPHRRTGLTVTLHATRAPLGLDQLDILREEGVDPRRVVVGHAQSYPVFEYHAEIARRGAFISFDRMGATNPYDLQKNLQLVRAVLDAGLEQHLVLSHDVCYRSDLATYGGVGFTPLSRHFPWLLREIGGTGEELPRIIIATPRPPPPPRHSPC